MLCQSRRDEHALVVAKLKCFTWVTYFACVARHGSAEKALKDTVCRSAALVPVLLPAADVLPVHITARCSCHLVLIWRTHVCSIVRLALACAWPLKYRRCKGECMGMKVPA